MFFSKFWKPKEIKNALSNFKKCKYLNVYDTISGNKMECSYS